MDRRHPQARKALAAIEPYIPGRSAEDVMERYHVREITKLGSNENPLGVSPRVKDAILSALGRIHHYPDPECVHLRRRLAARLGVTPEYLMVANGVDNVLTGFGLAFLDPGDRCVIGAPSYSAYVSLALLMNAVPIAVPLRDWRFDVSAMAAAAPGAKALIMCNPNNPTGTIVRHDEMQALLRQTPPTTLVVLDEAYAEWADDPGFPNGVALLREYSNLILMRTFSKLYGLAGLRVGYSIAAPEITACLYQVREPFPVDRLAQAAAEAVLDDESYLRASFENNRTGRAFLGAAFTDLGLQYVPSQANFLFVNLNRPAGDVAERLLPRGVIIRPGTIWKLPAWARITIGTPEENRRLVDALAAVLRGAV